MKYCDFIQVNQKFQSSVNLEYDLNKIEKIQGYIPTEQSVRILGAFLRSFYYNTEPQDRATVLIGPYGRGKSHLLLVLSALTSLDVNVQTKEQRRFTQGIQKELCEKITKVNREVGALATAVVESQIRALPVIINSNSTDVNQSFLVALNDALIRAGLENLLPSTYFDSAISVISKWEHGFPEAIEKLTSELRKRKIRLDDLKIGLKQFDQQMYRVFCECYPRVAAGTEFNPLTNMDVVKLYIAVANALREQSDYRGISIIFDEFSKFLEANLDKSRMLNFKIIQDMAEAATRSGDTQLHFTCITHKDILDYSASDSFKTVEGRFRKLRFVASSEQRYELISNAIIKSAAFCDFQDANKDEFERVANESARTNVFTDLAVASYEEKLVSGCFPLSPLSAFALLHVSELVGQNERTLFTFLAQDGQFTLRSFIRNDYDKPRWITVDYVYDYFEELFQKEIFNSRIHSIWAKTNAAIRQTKSDAQLKILKAIAIIQMIGDERLRAVPLHLKAALLLEDDEYDVSIKALLKKHILAQRDSSEFVLLTANGVDVQKSVDQYVKTALARINISEVLSKACDLGFVMPREYNDKFSMFRCFRNIFMEANVFASYKNANQLLSDYPYDGVIVHILNSGDAAALDRVYKKMQAFASTKQIVVCISSFECAIENLLKQYEAAQRLLRDEKDPHFVEELEVLSEDIQRRIQSAVYSSFSPSSEYSKYYIEGNEVEISRQVDLNQQISALCGRCYSSTPVVNNEMVNKGSLNAQNRKARDQVVAWVLQHAEDNAIPCMPGFGPEVSIYKSAFKRTGLDVSTRVQDEGINQVLEEIGVFLKRSEKNKSNFQSIYQTLSLPPFGMRKGIIPLFIAYALRPYKETIVLYFRGKEIELSASVLSNLNDNPESYEVLVETGTAEKNDYLDKLQNLFFKYSDSQTVSINRVYSIVKSMQNWMRSLPDFTKKFKRYFENGEEKLLPESIALLRSELLKFEINSRELLFSSFPAKLAKTGSLQDCYIAIKEAKVFLDMHLNEYVSELIKKLTAFFVPGYQGGMARAMISWYESLPTATKTHVFDSHTNAILTIAGAVESYDDEAIVRSMILSVEAIAIEDWNDAVADSFVKTVSEAIGRISDYIGAEGSGTQDGRLLITIEGVKVEKNFSAESISPLGKTAYNNLKSVLEEYNEALEPDEQLAILAKLIGEIVK